jgi:hypothetical protein
LIFIHEQTLGPGARSDLAVKLEELNISFAPGFSPVIIGTRRGANRFNGFLPH